MSDSSRRHRSVAVSALCVVVIVVVAVLLFRPMYVRETANSSPTSGTLVTYNYSCCTSLAINTLYRPGEVIAARWIRTKNPGTTGRAVPVALSMRISGPFPSVSSLKSAMIGPHPKVGATNVRSKTTTLLDTVRGNPQSVLRVPRHAASGFYNLTFTVGTSNLTQSGSSIIRVAG